MFHPAFPELGRTVAGAGLVQSLVMHEDTFVRFFRA